MGFFKSTLRPSNAFSLSVYQRIWRLTLTSAIRVAHGDDVALQKVGGTK